MKYYLHVLKNYFVFSGRARRSEYWYFALFNFVIMTALAMLALWNDSVLSNILLAILVIYQLFIIIPSLAVLVRRLHDVGKSGWMIFISLIPIVGGIWLLVLTLLDSKPGDNKYGPNPKNIPAPVNPSIPVSTPPVV